METAFLTAVALVVYTYLLYPAALWLLTFWKREPVPTAPEQWPLLTVIIVAVNEAAVIGDKLRNTLSLDYPSDRRRVIVVSDASDDGTDDIAAEFAELGVQLIRMPERAGKIMGQNVGVRQAEGDVLVFSDANSMYEESALKALVRPFVNPSVGCVCGELRYVNPAEVGAGKGEGVYWRYEQFLKRRESLLGSLVGANGAIYAMRRELFEELGPDIISDFIMPIRVRRKGCRAQYAPEAVAVEHSAKGFDEELRRRRRIIARSLYGLWTERGVLNPLATGIFSFQVVSHKVLRWLVPILLMTALGASGTRAFQGSVPFQGLFGLQVVFYALAFLGYVASGSLGRRGLFYVPAYFVSVNLGALLGLWDFVTGRRHTVWQPIERGQDADPED